MSDYFFWPHLQAAHANAEKHMNDIIFRNLSTAKFYGVSEYFNIRILDSHSTRPDSHLTFSIFVFEVQNIDI